MGNKVLASSMFLATALTAYAKAMPVLARPPHEPQCVQNHQDADEASGTAVCNHKMAKAHKL
eukprot:2892005-Amphidinium_carterae.1